jgi:hypothetical protein
VVEGERKGGRRGREEEERRRTVLALLNSSITQLTTPALHPALTPNATPVASAAVVVTGITSHKTSVLGTATTAAVRRASLDGEREGRIETKGRTEMERREARRRW